MVGTHQDITKEKRLEEALQQQQKREQLFNAVRKRIHSSSHVELILQTAVEEVQRFLQTDQTVIYRFHPNGTGMVVFKSVKEPYSVNSFIEGQNKASLVVPILLKVQEDENKPSVSIQNPQLALLNSCLGESQNHLWGLLITYDCCCLRQWQEWEIETVKQLSVEIAIALKQCQFEQMQTEIASRLFVEAQEKKNSQQLENTQEELKNTREQLLQNNKMANLGQVVAEVTKEIYHPIHFIHATLYSASDYAEELIRLLELYQHYYPNPVPVISSQLQRLDLDFIKTDFLKLLWSMQAGSERIKDIVFALQSFSNFGDGQMRKANLHQGLGHVLRILQHRLQEQPNRPRIEVIKEFGELPLVDCYPDELNQVFLNILTNAIDALEERLKYDGSFTPKIWVHTEVIQSHLSLVRQYNQQPLKQHKVVICISDNGKGILPHIQRHIFEPLFTTKAKSKGKGLGLSISQQIIAERHQGKLQCYSELGKGTEFVIEINIKAKHGERYHQIS
ncbi:GAF domain-containing protein [Tolypothrix campylonemoides VB511288]|nr:GAF domain-containing protein [Tolypothrix campylonemoides VB511288]